MIPPNILLIAALGALALTLSGLALRARVKKSQVTPHFSIAAGVTAFLFFASLPDRFSPVLVAAGFAFVAGFLMVLCRQDRSDGTSKTTPPSSIVRILPPESFLSETGSWRLRNREEYLSRSGVWRLKQ